MLGVTHVGGNPMDVPGRPRQPDRAVEGGGRLLPATGVSAFPLDDELVLCQEPSGQVFILNRTGAQIWTLLDGIRTAPEVAAELSDLYNLTYEQSVDDVEELIAELVRAGLVGPG